MKNLGLNALIFTLFTSCGINTQENHSSTQANPQLEQLNTNLCKDIKITNIEIKKIKGAVRLENNVATEEMRRGFTISSLLMLCTEFKGIKIDGSTLNTLIKAPAANIENVTSTVNFQQIEQNLLNKAIPQHLVASHLYINQFLNGRFIEATSSKRFQYFIALGMLGMIYIMPEENGPINYIKNAKTPAGSIDNPIPSYYPQAMQFSPEESSMILYSMARRLGVSPLKAYYYSVFMSQYINNIKYDKDLSYLEKFEQAKSTGEKIVVAQQMIVEYVKSHNNEILHSQYFAKGVLLLAKSIVWTSKQLYRQYDLNQHMTGSFKPKFDFDEVTYTYQARVDWVAFFKEIL